MVISSMVRSVTSAADATALDGPSFVLRGLLDFGT
jgi:hypothetical protein